MREAVKETAELKKEAQELLQQLLPPEVLDFLTESPKKLPFFHLLSTLAVKDRRIVGKEDREKLRELISELGKLRFPKAVLILKKERVILIPFTAIGSIVVSQAGRVTITLLNPDEFFSCDLSEITLL